MRWRVPTGTQRKTGENMLEEVRAGERMLRASLVDQSQPVPGALGMIFNPFT